MTSSSRFRTAAGMLVLALACCAAAGAQAQAYPSKPVRLVLPFPPGGGTDVVGRLVAQKLSASTGQPFVVENRAGAGGRIGADLVAKSPPDGYTLMLGTSSVTGTGPALFPEDSAVRHAEGFRAGIARRLYRVPAGDSSFRSRVVGERADRARKIAARATDVFIVGCRRRVAPVRRAVQLDGRDKDDPRRLQGQFARHAFVVAGETDLGFNNTLPALPQVKSGRLRALGVTTPQRSALLPGVPTIAESGLPGFEVQQNYGVLAPAGALPARNRPPAQPGNREGDADGGCEEPAPRGRLGGEGQHAGGNSKRRSWPRSRSGRKSSSRRASRKSELLKGKGERFAVKQTRRPVESGSISFFPLCIVPTHMKIVSILLLAAIVQLWLDSLRARAAAVRSARDENG